MEYAELLREAGFDNRRAFSNPNNIRAVVQATERYVAEHDPTFQRDLIASLENAFGIGGISTGSLFAPKYFTSQTIRKVPLLDVVRELYPDADRTTSPDCSPCSTLFYVDREKLLRYMRERTTRREVVIIEFRKNPVTASE